MRGLERVFLPFFSCFSLLLFFCKERILRKTVSNPLAPSRVGRRSLRESV